MKKEYNVEVDCANCAIEMEEAIKKMDKVKNAEVNFIMKTINLEYDDNVDEKEFIKSINDNLKNIDDDMKVYI